MTGISWWKLSPRLSELRSHVLEFMMMSLKAMDSEGHTASHFAVVPNQSLNKLHIVFELVIPQEARKQAIPSYFSVRIN